MNKKISVSFLFDKKNKWFSESYLKELKSALPKGYKYYFSFNFKKVKGYDILFLINYTKILPKDFLISNKLNLVLHSSNLPMDRGFSPAFNQILRNRNTITTCLIEAKEKVDTGNIYMKNKFRLDGNELSREIRAKQALAMIQLVTLFLKKYPKIKSIKQKAGGSFNPRRRPSDSEINIDKSLKSQFNLLRINDNENFPSYFYFKKKKYILKIYNNSELMIDNLLTYKKINNITHQRLIWKMHNDITSRKYSVNKESFSNKNHVKWLKDILKNKKEFIYLAKKKKEIIGLVRHKKKGNKLWLSWALLKEFRGKNYGTRLIGEFIKKNNNTFFAVVHKLNFKSIKICKKVGFKLIEKKGNFLFYKKNKFK